jgi:hypothetical protein
VVGGEAASLCHLFNTDLKWVFQVPIRTAPGTSFVSSEILEEGRILFFLLFYFRVLLGSVISFLQQFFLYDGSYYLFLRVFFVE